MFARVLRLRQMGVLLKGAPPPDEQWAAGILEMTTRWFGGPTTSKRLILRDARASPDRGLLFELFQPTVVDIKEPYVRLRGIEAVSLGSDEVGAMVQEWLVRLR